MLNKHQLDIAEKVLVNSANVILATQILGSFFNPRGSNLKLFLMGCILFSLVVRYAFWLRRRNDRE